MHVNTFPLTDPCAVDIHITSTLALTSCETTASILELCQTVALSANWKFDRLPQPNGLDDRTSTTTSLLIFPIMLDFSTPGHILGNRSELLTTIYIPGGNFRRDSVGEADAHQFSVDGHQTH